MSAVDWVILLIVVVMTGGLAGVLVIGWLLWRSKAWRYRKTLTPVVDQDVNQRWRWML